MGKMGDPTWKITKIAVRIIDLDFNVRGLTKKVRVSVFNHITAKNKEINKYHNVNGHKICLEAVRESLHSSHFLFYMKELHSGTHDTAQCIEHSLENYAMLPEHNIPARSEWNECQHQGARRKWV
jgi:hypothetical protein